MAQSAVDVPGAVAEGRRAIDARQFDDAILALQGAIPSATEIRDERKRKEALAAIHFYSAVAFEGISNDPKAREELEQFFRFSPDAAKLDPSKFRAHFVDLFNEVRRNRLASQRTSLFDELYAGYREFSTERPRPTGIETWETGPDYVLLARKDERERWRGLHDDEARRRFVVEFWKRRDPTPESESNELRDRFESRVAFADSAFSTESVRGAVSDRGRVFILLGKPRIVRNLPLTRAEGATIPRASTVVADGTVERWVFFAEQVPAGVPKREVSFSFITQIGYGDYVMQRDFFAIEALDAAAKTMRVR